MKILIQILFLIAVMPTFSSDFKLQEGDFLFQDVDCGALCNAIEEVTEGVNGANLSHVGLVVIENDSFMVAEAISKGVLLTPLNDFINRSLDAINNPKILVGRLKSEYNYLIPKAISNLKKYIGKPYNHSYIWGNDEYYCSQLLQIIFKEANQGVNLFELAPMTFKSPKTGSFYPAWVEYYKTLNIDIPEGLPGINPGGMSRSSTIEIVHSFGNVSGYKK